VGSTAIRLKKTPPLQHVGVGNRVFSLRIESLGRAEADYPN
jgi:hypothetical protein